MVNKNLPLQFPDFWKLMFVVLKGLYHPACFACAVFWFAFVVTSWPLKKVTTKGNQETTCVRNAG